MSHLTAGKHSKSTIFITISLSFLQNILAMMDPKTGKPVPPGSRPPKFVKQNQTCLMRLECPEVFCMERYKDFSHMGRFTLRDEGLFGIMCSTV